MATRGVRFEEELRGRKLEDLQKIYKRFQNVANRRLNRLEKLGYVAGVVDTTTNYIKRQFGSKRFPKAAPEDRKSLIRALQELRHFVNSETSTVTGYRKHVNKSYATFIRNNPEFASLSQKEWLDFFTSENYKSLLAMHVPSGMLVEFIHHSRESNVTKRQVMDAFNKYRQGKLETISDLYESVGLDMSSFTPVTWYS